MNNLIKNTTSLFFILLIYSCSTPNPEDYSKYLNGYWEIEKVITSDGIEKHYNFNQTIDFFKVNELQGIRKKLQPQWNGSFMTSKDAENFTLKIEHDSLRVYYTTAFTNWKETVVSAKENQMIIKNEVGNLYFYKPYKKLELIDDGKKTK